MAQYSVPPVLSSGKSDSKQRHTQAASQNPCYHFFVQLQHDFEPSYKYYLCGFVMVCRHKFQFSQLTIDAVWLNEWTARIVGVSRSMQLCR